MNQRNGIQQVHGWRDNTVRQDRVGNQANWTAVASFSLNSAKSLAIKEADILAEKNASTKKPTEENARLHKIFRSVQRISEAN